MLRGIQALFALVLAISLAGCPGGSTSGESAAVAVACPAGQAQAMMPAPPPGMPPAGIGNLARQQINTGFALNSPLFLTAPSGDTNRLFVVEQGGLIKLVNRANNTLIGTFLDLTGPVLAGGERGLLGMVFDPDYATNGRFYVSYTRDPDGASVIARYLVSADPNVALPSADRIILTVSQPFSNHNGGMIAFGPDKLLYIGFGDGGSGNDPGNRAQNSGELLGKLLRIDVSQGATMQPAYLIPNNNPCVGVSGAQPEIWSIGLRNPWRYSFDRQSGDLYIADVGQSALEEVNVSTVAAGAGRGTNYGWRVKEGTACTNLGPGSCNSSDLQAPAVEYAHTGGACSVTGGYVYRGSAIPALQGTYFYADHCAGFVRSFRVVNGMVTEHAQWASLAGGNVSSFGEDANGELYILTLGGGLFRIVPN